MNRFSTLSAIVVCAAGLALLPGCGGRTAPEGDVINIGNGAEPEGLDPHIVTGVPEHHVLTTLFEGLVGLDPDTLEPIPGVAERWDVSDDGLEYTFHLRDNARWSNGDSVTARDFAYAWRRILTPSVGSQYAYMLYPMKNAQAYNEGDLDDFSKVGCEVIDDRTIKVQLDHPTPYFLQLHTHYTWFPVHQATIEKFGPMDDRASKWTRPGNLVGNGPYILTRWVPNRVIEVRPNEHYWDAANVKNAGVNFYPINDELAEERMFRAGELHITESVPQAKVAEYQENNPEMLRIDPWIGVYFYRVNTTRKPLDDPRVRRALAMAIDRDVICTRVMRTGQIPAHFLTPPDTAGYTAEARIPYDVAGARELLAEAGYPNGEGFPTIDILYNTMDQHQMIAEAIQQMWKNDLGIDVTLTNQEWKVYLNSTDQMDYDLARAGWIGDVVDPINFLECFVTNGGNNRTGWSSPEYDDLLRRARQQHDLDERYALYQQAEAIFVDAVPVIPIYHYTRNFLIRPEVRGYPGNQLAHRVFHKVWLDHGTESE